MRNALRSIRSRKSLGNAAGLSLVEMVLCVALLSIVTFGIIDGFAWAQKSLLHTQSVQRRNQEITNLIDSVRANVRMYQAHWDASLDPRAELDRTELPLAWNSNSVVDAASCTSCPGRLGYIVQPHPDDFMRGVYVVTIKVSHAELFPAPRYFQFMSSLR